MMQGGVQVNLKGERFSNEHGGYSEQAAKVLAQPEQVAWNLYDARIHESAQAFEDYRNAEESGAVRSFSTLEEMATGLKLPLGALQATFTQMQQHAEQQTADAFGRRFEPANLLKAPTTPFASPGRCSIPRAAWK